MKKSLMMAGLAAMMGGTSGCFFSFQPLGVFV